MEIEVFYSGRHTDGSGRTKDFPPEEIDALAATYNQRYPQHQAPAVLGHPMHDEWGNSATPAYGWVERFEARDGIVNGRPARKLYARFKQFYKPFLSAVKEGRWKNRSLYIDNGLIMHVGWLGKALPALPMMEDPTLNPDGWATFNGATPAGSFAVWSDENLTYAEPGQPAGGAIDTAKPSTGKAMDEQQFNDMMALLQTISNGLTQLMQKAGIGAAPAAAPAGGAAPAPGGKPGGFTAPTAPAVPTTLTPVNEGGTQVNNENPNNEAAQQQQGAFSAQQAVAAAAQQTALMQEVATLRQQVQEGQFAQFLDSPEMRVRVLPAMRESTLNFMRTLAAAQQHVPAGTYAAGKSPLEEYMEQLKALPAATMVGGDGHFAKLRLAGGGTPADDPCTKEAEAIVATRKVAGA